MMAKEPQERFASPGEVALWLEPLSDASELAGLVAAHEAADQATLGGLLGMEGWDPDAARRLARQSAASEAARRGSAARQTAGPQAAATRREGPRPWFRRAGPLVSGALLTALAVGFGAWLGMHNNRPAPIVPPPPAALDRHKLALELTLLPGLNGEWWFDEMPWFVPFVRQAVAGGLESDPDPLALLGNTPAQYLDPNVAEVRRWLWDVVQPPAAGCRRTRAGCWTSSKRWPRAGWTTSNWPALTQSIRRQTEGPGPGDKPAGAWPGGTGVPPGGTGVLPGGTGVPPGGTGVLPGGTGVPPVRPTATGETPVPPHALHLPGASSGVGQALQRHTLAVLEHRAAALANDRQMAEAAKKSYDEAVAAYLPAAGAAPPLRALCLADLARLHAEVLDNQKEAVRCFDQALAVPGLPPLFRVETLTACGDAAAAGATTAGEYEDHRFLSAKRILAASEAGKRSHPGRPRRRALRLEPDGAVEGRGGRQTVPRGV